MRVKHFFLSAAVTGIAAYALFRQTNRLKLIYNEESGQLIIDRKYSVRLCRDIIIDSLVIRLNRDIYKGFDYSEEEKAFDSAIFVDLPNLETGDLIEVMMKTRCSRILNKKGKLDIV
ncbi:MAG: hypothetical protein P8100_06230 [bacterium]|jgi:hypothetical protein